MRTLPDLGAEAPLPATLVRSDGRWLLTLERPLPAGPAGTWDWLTQPDRLAHWSPCVPDRPLTRTGTASVRENPDDEPSDAEVLLADAPRQLVHRWGDEIVGWTLTTRDGGSTLTLDQSVEDRRTGANAAAGWHVCLVVLEAALRGEPLGRIVGQDAVIAGWERLHDRYLDLFAQERGVPQ